MTDFEDALRRVVDDSRITAVPPSLQAIQLRASRRKWRRQAAAVAGVIGAVVAVVATVNLGGGPSAVEPVLNPTPTASAMAADVPWADLVMGPFVSGEVSPTSSVSAPNCRADDLSLRLAGAGSGMTGGQFQELVDVSTTRTCYLSADVQHVSAVVQGRRVALPTTGSYGILSAGQPGVISPNHPGGLWISFNTECEFQSPPPVTLRHTDFRITLLGRAFDIAPGGDVAPVRPEPGVLVFCSTEISVSRAGARPVDPVYLHQPESDLVASLQVPESVEAGSTLRYVVTLSNPTDHDVALSPCPSFVEVLATKEDHRLNCAAAHPVAAHGEESFAMELPIAPGAAPGATTLRWELLIVTQDPIQKQEPFAASAPLMIT